MSISTADIKALREATGAGVLDCKKALEEANGDIDQAVEFLRKKGLAAAAKKASREANEGRIEAYVDEARQTGVMIEVNCETDFVARTDDFQNMVDQLVQHLYQNPDITTIESLLASPSPEDSSKTVQEQLTEAIARLGENMLLRQVVRFDLETDGLIDGYIHMGNRVGVLVEVAGGSPHNEKFVELAHDVALQIAAAAPQYLTTDEIDPDTIEAERNIYQAQFAEDKKPDHIKERIIDGKLNKWYSEVVLMNQQFVKDTNLSIEQLLHNKSKELGQDIRIHRFARFELGSE